MTGQLRVGLLVVGLVSLAAVAVVLAARPGADARPPLHPASTGRSGTKALVEVLEALGHDVVVADAVEGPARAQLASAERVLLLVDRLSDQGREDLTGWVRRGGTLVVADPGSPLSAEPVRGAPLEGVPPRCGLDAVEGVRAVEARVAVALGRGSGTTNCFPTDFGYWLVADPTGDGMIVSLGGAEPLVNTRLQAADNVLLAHALLAPRRRSRVLVLYPLTDPGPLAAGDEPLALWDLVPRRVRLGLLQAAVAFTALVLWRGRRLGQPVEEPQAVVIPGSQLTVASGRLLQQARAREAAGRILRNDLRRHLARWLGLLPATPVEVVADVAATRSGLPRDRLAQVLDGAPPAQDADLLALAQQVDEVRTAVLQQHRARSAAERGAGAPWESEPHERAGKRGS